MAQKKRKQSRKKQNQVSAPRKTLTPRQRAFVDHYLADRARNATAAYIKAGYTARGNAAEANASRLLRNDKVQAYINEQLDKLSMRHQITAERILQEYARLALFDPRKLFDSKGRPIPISDLDDDTAAALAGLDVQEVYEFDGEERVFVGYVKKYKLADKKAALDKLAEYLQLLKPKGEGTNDNEITIRFVSSKAPQGATVIDAELVEDSPPKPASGFTITVPDD